MKGTRRSPLSSTYFWWVGLCIVMISLSLKFPAGQKLDLAIAPLLHAIQAPVRWSDQALLWFHNAAELQHNYTQSQNELAQQQSTHHELTALRTENKQLRQLLNITLMEGYTWRASRVISRSPEEKSRRLMLQVALANQDDVIVSHRGLVGLVDHTSKQHVVVRTILDASLAVPVTMEHSDLAGLVRGDGDRLLVDFIPLVKAPQVGDILITSGAGGLFPAGLPVAIVEEVQPVDDGVFAHVQASPVAHWQRDVWLAIATRQQTSP